METTIQLIGSLAAVITTIGWFPQVLKIVRERRADDISLVANAAIAAGVMLWFVYGLMIESWPVIIANGVTFLLIAAIVALKLHFTRRTTAEPAATHSAG